ncbi:MAG: hypothetical protein JSV49_10170 [Thermoplasmata archaeon]|nr:MAG: hypothetical protein JSV49_10170 [Thermoplasmata archaeon]
MNSKINTKSPKKKTKIVWILAIITILILSAIFVVYLRATKEMVPSFKVIIDVEVIDSVPTIETIEYSYEEVALPEKPKETSSHMPGIYLIAFGSRVEEEYFQPYTEWTSTDFKGDGTYELTAGFQFEPEKGEIIKVEIKIINNVGKTIGGQIFTIIWEYEPVLEASCTLSTINETYVFNDVEVKRNWIDPDEIIQREQENLPGLHFIIEKNGFVANYANSIPVDDVGTYTVRGFLLEVPKIGEILQLNLQLKDSKGNVIASYPNINETWNYKWF